MVTDTSSTPKAIRNKTMDSKSTGNEVTSSNLMDMDDRTRLTQPDTTMPAARRIDNMTNEANSDQVEEDTLSNPMAMDMQGMAMLVGSIMILAYRIGNMILDTSNDQKEVNAHQ